MSGANSLYPILSNNSFIPVLFNACSFDILLLFLFISINFNAFSLLSEISLISEMSLFEILLAFWLFPFSIEFLLPFLKSLLFFEKK